MLDGRILVIKCSENMASVEKKVSVEVMYIKQREGNEVKSLTRTASFLPRF